MDLRSYQKQALGEARRENIILVLPTGAGKTLVAAKLILEALERHPDRRVLFVAPTNPLVDQQRKVVEEEVRAHRPFQEAGLFPEIVTLPSRRREPPPLFSIIVATPAGLLNSLPALPWQDTSLLVLDECHHVNKDHPCAGIMASYRQAAKAGCSPRFLGLTASPAAGAKCEKFPEKLEKLQEACRARILAPGEASLGEHINIPEVTVSQVRESVDHPLAKARRLLHALALERLRRYSQSRQAAPLPIDPISGYFFGEEEDEGEDEGEGEGEGRWPRDPGSEDLHRGRIYLMASSVCDLLGPKHCLELLRKVPNMRAGELAEAIGLLEEEEESVPPKLSQLWRELAGQHEADREARGIVFVQTRKVAEALEEKIKQHPSPRIRELRAAKLIGHTKRREGEARVTQAEQRRVLDAFRRGEVNLLLATSVAEEGLDIPRCNYVVRVDPWMTPISLIQSRGRARFPTSRFLALCWIPEDRSALDRALTGEKVMKELLLELDAQSGARNPLPTTWDSPRTTWESHVRTSHHHLALRSHLPPPKISYKNKFQEFAQLKWGLTLDKIATTLPPERKGPPHCPTFVVTVRIRDLHFTGAPSPTKMESEQSAFELALRHPW